MLNKNKLIRKVMNLKNPRNQVHIKENNSDPLTYNITYIGHSGKHIKKSLKQHK